MVDGETPDESRLVDVRIHCGHGGVVSRVRWSHCCTFHNVVWTDEQQHSPCPWCALEDARKATRCFVRQFQFDGGIVTEEDVARWPWIKPWVMT